MSYHPFMPASPESVRYLAVELGAEGAAEWADRRRIVFVPRDGIRGIELRRGIAGERPALQVIVGVAAILGGMYLLASLGGVLGLVFMGFASRMAARFAMGGALIACLGAWVLWTGVRPAYFLLVRTADDARKLVLAPTVELEHVSTFLHSASQRFGYVVEWRIDVPRPPVPPFR